MNAHSNTQFRIILQRLRDFQGAQCRCFRIVSEHECSTVTCRQTQQLAFGLGRTELFRPAHDLPQFLNLLGLFVDAQFGVTNNVDEEDMRDLHSQFVCFGFGHRMTIDLLFGTACFGLSNELDETRIFAERIPERVELEVCNR